MKLQCKFANMQSYRNVVVRISPFIFIKAATPDEILADKIVAISLRKNLQGRDMWDIYYLLDQLSNKHNVHTDYELIMKKFLDYNCQPSGIAEKITSAVDQIEKRGLSEFRQEMLKVFPRPAYNLFESKFTTVVEIVRKVLTDALCKFSEGR
ncbi:nucleotidyl transferase AbiEii/AbiGii toxin family protein [Caldicellulosiruptor acetigenus]|uniref:nucleotidyl transferase AbiEii/AbiGii toxin family protein n=1 Tax=Caldicellulosiruptor acetigenus TaxID=301953 RepID=UPI00040F45E1|nr:nucleotidyl transferase AbiEii/AbiGii toxin family protein [Caldicellulosiruptor acetigenus]WAM36942.1 nucleotidyl transferase AbiEii/AbiGii toxin family protein [Caldicellulosiruptor acetigenus]